MRMGVAAFLRISTRSDLRAFDLMAGADVHVIFPLGAARQTGEPVADPFAEPVALVNAQVAPATGTVALHDGAVGQDIRHVTPS